MTDTDAEPSFRLIYRSRSRIAHDRRKAELGALFSTARSNNNKRGVTGALLLSEDWFVQALEGNEAVVRALFARISKDTRHEDVSLVEARAVDTRVFGRWSMAEVGEEGEPDIPLLMNVDKGGASPAAPRPTTTEQDRVLDFMRSLTSEESQTV